MPSKTERRRNQVSAVQHAARRIAGLVLHRGQAGRGLRVSADLWADLGLSERQFWRAMNALPGWIARTRIYDHDAAKWFVLLTVCRVVPGSTTGGLVVAEHQARLPLAARVAPQLVAFTRAVLGKMSLGAPDPEIWTDARCQADGAGLIRLAMPAVAAFCAPMAAKDAPECTPGASRRRPRVWNSTRCGLDRVAGVRARRLLASAGSMGYAVPEVLGRVAACYSAWQSNTPECQRLYTGGLRVNPKANMESQAGRPCDGAGLASRAACGPPSLRQPGRSLTEMPKLQRRRVAWAIAAKLLERSSGSEMWGRALVSHWICKHLGRVPEAAMVRALERGLVWAWGGYVLAKSSKARPAPPNTLSALAHAEKALGLR